MGALFEPRLAVNLWSRPEGQGHGLGHGDSRLCENPRIYRDKPLNMV